MDITIWLFYIFQSVFQYDAVVSYEAETRLKDYGQESRQDTFQIYFNKQVAYMYGENELMVWTREKKFFHFFSDVEASVLLQGGLGEYPLKLCLAIKSDEQVVLGYPCYRVVFHGEQERQLIGYCTDSLEGQYLPEFFTYPDGFEGFMLEYVYEDSFSTVRAKAFSLLPREN